MSKGLYLYKTTKEMPSKDGKTQKQYDVHVFVQLQDVLDDGRVPEPIIRQKWTSPGLINSLPTGTEVNFDLVVDSTWGKDKVVIDNFRVTEKASKTATKSF